MICRLHVRLRDRFGGPAAAWWRRGLAGWGLILAAAGSASELRLPLLDGNLEGDFTALQLPGAPPLHWKLEVTPVGQAGRAATVRIAGPGSELQAELRIDGTGAVQWRLNSSRLDLGTWFPAVLPMLGPEMAAATAQGTVTARGEGSWQAGRWIGRAEIEIADGRFEDPGRKTTVEGIALKLVLEDVGALRSAPGQIMSWTSARFDTIPLGAGRMTFALEGEQIQVEDASSAIWGGEVKLAAFAFALSRMEMSVIARVIGIDLAQLLTLLPPVLAEARGRLDGSFSVRRDSSGLQIGAGRLALQSGEPAELKLAPTPGLLSGSLPPTVLKYYPGLGEIETGQIPLQATLLEVAFTPGGDSEGRTASVHLTGGPVDPKLRAPIDLTINVRGPLESLIKFGTNSRVRFGSGP